MSTNNTYLAVFLGSKTSPRRARPGTHFPKATAVRRNGRHGSLEGLGRETSAPPSSAWADPWAKPRRSRKAG